MASLQRRPPKRPPQPLRTVSKALRTLGTSEDIQCTHSLIQAYNANDAAAMMGIALHHWLEAYVDEFSKWKAECMHENWIREYALLALVEVKSSAAAGLLRRAYVSLRACIKIGEYCSPIIVVAVENMLRVMDAKVVEKETQSLISLADDLLSLTDPKKCIYTRDTYPFHMACLLTLERTLIVLHGVECVHSKQWIVQFFQNKLKAQLKAIAAKQNYYPFVYNTQLIKYNIGRLIDGDATALLLNVGRRAFYALCGGLYLFQGIRELAVMRLDFAAIEAGVRKMHQAFSGLVDIMAPGLQEVALAASKSETTKDFRHMMECYKRHENPSFVNRMKPKKLKIVKFALISHLTLFAIDGSTGDLSDQAFDLLSRLAVNPDTEKWRADPDIYECLLDAFASVGAKLHSRRHECLQLLHQMENTSIREHRTAVKDWRGRYSVQQKLDMKCDNESKIPNPSLYDTVRKQLGLHLTHVHSVKLKQELIEYYQDEEFAKVSLLLDEGENRHIADFDFHIVMYETVNTENRLSNIATSNADDHMAHNLERCRRVEEPIKLQEIFTRRHHEPSKLKEEASRVLLLGNPGTGKTSLSKRLCYGWAIGEWGSEFHQVYLLPIRQLTGNRIKADNTLEEAIAVLLLNANRKSEDERKAIHHQVKDDLDEKTTLLMLDGLDEANGNELAEEIVKNAVSRSCTILVLSRPHNLGTMCSKMDRQVECLGFNDDQLKDFVFREAHDTSKKLIGFLKGSLVVWQIAHVPINAQILFTLWNSEVGHILKESKSVGLKTLYSMMIEYTWQRFKEKTGANVDRQLVFSSLELIAFKAISQGKIEIAPHIVRTYAHGTTTYKLLLDSGQFLAKKLQGTEKEIKEAKKYIADRKYCDTSRVTLSFMVQCFCKEDDANDDIDCIERLKQLLSILDENPVELVGFQHTMLKMRTLDAFLSSCGSCAEAIRSDDDLERVVQFAITSLTGWMKAQSQFVRRRDSLEVANTVFDRFMEDLERMPSLFTHLPEFLQIVLRHCHESHHVRLARLVSYAQEQLLQIVPKELRGDDGHDRDDDDVISLLYWFVLFARAGPECAILVLEQLKTASQDQREEVRESAFSAIVCFLKVLPERGDLQALFLHAFNEMEAYVRYQCLMNLRTMKFKPNSVAEDLVWALAMKATKDEDELVRRMASRALLSMDQTSEERIEKTCERMLELAQAILDGDVLFFSLDVDNIFDFLIRFPTKLTLFLPYFATWCNHGTLVGKFFVKDKLRNFSSHLPTPQRRELGEMFAKIYCNVKEFSRRLIRRDCLYEIGHENPDLMSDFPDVFSEISTEVEADCRLVVKRMKIEHLLTTAEIMSYINERFWDLSFEAKGIILYQIDQEDVINAETADLVMEMAVNCQESDDQDVKNLGLDILLTVAKFRSLSSPALCYALDHKATNDRETGWKILFGQPLERLLQYFWDTADVRMVTPIAQKLMIASFTSKAAHGGKSIVSIMENGKNTQQNVPTELVEKLIRLVKDELGPHFGHLFS